MARNGSLPRFALRRGIWRWAVHVAAERRGRPAGIALPDGRALASAWRTIAADRVHVRASTVGDPDRTVVLVHGVIVSSRYLMPLGVELAGVRRVLVPDLPGYGLSDPPEQPLTLAALADAAIACADDCQGPIALVGNSFGAQVVAEAAVRHPDRVGRIALLGPTVDPTARSLLRQYVRWQRGALAEHPSAFAVMARDVADAGIPRAARLLRIMLADAIEAKLPAIACPALVVRGDRDRVAPAEWAERAARLLPDGRLATIRGYGHMAHYSGPLTVAPLLRAFLDAG